MSFIVFDLIFLAVFCIAVGIFLYKNKKKLKVESKVFLLYRTKKGLKFINWASKKFSKILPVLSYISIIFGVFAMIAIIILFVQSLLMMIVMPTIIKAPPIMPLLPYVPQAFNLPLPPFYFTHWIVAIVILATTHEFAHGIFAKFYKVNIKSTGFGFLGPFLAAFVEPDEKVMQRKKPKQQLAILSAGSFSNFVFAIVFLLLMQLFFVLAYVPSGIGHYYYSYNAINLTEIKSIGNYSTEEFLNLSNEQINAINTTIELKTNNATYYITPELMKEISNNKEYLTKQNKIIAFANSPAFNVNLSGGIKKIGSFEIKKIEDITFALNNYKPGQTITIVTSEKTYNVTLAEHPLNSSKAYLGIAFPQLTNTQKIISSLTSPFFYPYTYTKPKFASAEFIKNFFLWLVLIFFFVAIFNMLPLGFLDGGRFIYVAFFGLTKSKKVANALFNVVSSIMILIFLLMMIVWFVRII